MPLDFRRFKDDEILQYLCDWRISKTNNEDMDYKKVTITELPSFQCLELLLHGVSCVRIQLRNSNTIMEPKYTHFFEAVLKDSNLQGHEFCFLWKMSLTSLLKGPFFKVIFNPCPIFIYPCICIFSGLNPPEILR